MGYKVSAELKLETIGGVEISLKGSNLENIMTTANHIIEMDREAQVEDERRKAEQPSGILIYHTTRR
jgi:hypothetical protein